MLYWGLQPEALSNVRVALLSDIHSNLEALSAVLDAAGGREAIDEVWCLGDVVGYGPDPTACLDVLLGMEHVMVIGNHDLAAIGKLSLAEFNPYAAAACRWTARQLSADHREALAALPERVERGPFTLVHGSPRNPAWEYVTSVRAARACLEDVETPCCLVGHTHLPMVFRLTDDGMTGEWARPGQVVSLAGERLVLNPGGVGQPRDGDPRACYAIYDTDESTVEFRRVAYDVATTQRKMRQAGLPEYLADRLAFGR